MSLVVNPVGNKCSGGAQPGTVALRDGLLPRFPPCSNLGVYACRDRRGGSSLSVHAEGRAWDAGFPKLHPQGSILARFCVKHAAYLNIQRVIWDNNEWSADDQEWEPYFGTDPHDTHVHIEQNWEGAWNLTRAQVEKLFKEEEVAKGRYVTFQNTVYWLEWPYIEAMNTPEELMLHRAKTGNAQDPEEIQDARVLQGLANLDDLLKHL